MKSTFYNSYDPHYSRFRSFGAFLSSVRFRLTLWYFIKVAAVLFIFGGTLYASESSLNSDANDARLETPLYQDLQHLSDIYGPQLTHGQQPSSRQLALSSREVALLLRPDGTVLERRGPLTEGAMQQLQGEAFSNRATLNLRLPLQGSAGGQVINGDYRFALMPVMEGDRQLALLLVGLPRDVQVHLWGFWFARGIVVLLISAFGGYWLASKAMRPVQQITRMANEISATDLRRRLHLKRRDEFGELAATFDQMLARLEGAFKRQTQFTADASHELRTPLTIIDLEINRALTQLQTPEEYRQVLEQIQAESMQMAEIVNSLLLLARADTGQIELHQETVDLSDIALACVERLLPVARQSNVAVSTGKLPELLVAGDSQYLSRMLLNLVENAIKYTGGVGKYVRVDLLCEQQKWGVIRVQDDGPGIADEHLPYLFERFYRVDKARTHHHYKGVSAEPGGNTSAGTGLGLSIVQWIVQAHHGEVWVESRIGAGTTFEVRLPLLTQNLHVAAGV